MWNLNGSRTRGLVCSPLEMLCVRVLSEWRRVLNTEMAMQCDAKILAIRVLAAEILCDVPPRCENTSDAAMPPTQCVWHSSPCCLQKDVLEAGPLCHSAVKRAESKIAWCRSILLFLRRTYWG